MKKLIVFVLAVVLFGSCKKDKDSTVSIGDTYQGGIVFYLDGNCGGLIAAPTDQGQAEWGCLNTTIGTGSAIGTGAQNTIDIELGCITPGTAADICANLTLGGYSDWFLPSKDELNEMSKNIGQVNGSNGNIGGLHSWGGYWSSTERNTGQNAGQVWGQLMTSGFQDDGDKDNSFFVRSVRAF